MQVKAVINEKYQEMEIHVCNHKKDESVTKVVEDISKFMNETLVGTLENGDKIQMNSKDVISFFSHGPKNYARTEKYVLSISKKLYELEAELDEKQFVRISKSEIVNLKKIRKLDMSITGTIKVCFSDGSETYTSRRNIVKLKKALGV